MSLYGLSYKIAKYITEESELERIKIDNIRYGLEIILGTLIKAMILLTAAYLLGILPQVIVALFCGSLLRLVSGGAHCTSYLRCLSCGLVVYLSIGKFSLYLEKCLNIDQLAIILAPSFLIMTFNAFLWAPAEVPYRTLNSRESIFFKGLTLIFMIIWLTVVIHYINQIRLSYIMAGLLALLMQTLSFTPLGYLVIGKIDTLMLNIITKRGGEIKNAKN